ncbi:SAF domain-containing protein [Paenibacillus sp. UMB4589-SE434]|uniref:SAF domain-containing protein n=1 Tax=Paenibacillus sp. UMB4589-SE434 TaxID=3046314 RepID=UPI00254AF768|nr:SAF domain-containing protein [Paenibacillus sp. UMB4589-SE434]MDK8180382.1 SAF domain-containing protein [Paenibacillus sp. UMB4589-SE434]
MIRRWTRRTKLIVVAVTMSAGCVGIISGTVMIYSQQVWSQERQQLELALEKARKQAASSPKLITNSSSGVKHVWRFKKPLESGYRLTEQDIERIVLPSIWIPDQQITKKEDIVGKLLKLDVTARTPVLASMLIEGDGLVDDVRWIETTAIQLPLELLEGDVLDVRIRFADGQDFVVLSHKRVEKLKPAIIWMQFSEQELLMMSSACVDAYVNSAQLYAVRYVDPMLQQRAIINYPVNAEVMALIEKDPNIVKTSNAVLSAQSRRVLESHLDKLRVIEPERSNFFSGQASTYEGSQNPFSSTPSKISQTPNVLPLSPFTGHDSIMEYDSPFTGQQKDNTLSVSEEAGGPSAASQQPNIPRQPVAKPKTSNDAGPHVPNSTNNEVSKLAPELEMKQSQ